MILAPALLAGLLAARPGVDGVVVAAFGAKARTPAHAAWKPRHLRWR